MVHLVLAFALALIAAPASAQNAANWPDKPVRLIVPFPAGSSTDLVARIIAQKLGLRLGQQVIVDNRSGASGAIGSDAVARAAADGYTIGLATLSTHALAPSLNPNLLYNPATDFAPVGMIGSQPYVLGVYAGLPAKNVAELIALAKAKPRALNYASAGAASLAHLAGALFAYMAHVELTHVPYRSSSQAVLDLTEGRIEMQFATLPPALPLIADGRLRALATTGAARVAMLPQVPTLAEPGFADYDVALWFGLAAPAKIAPAIIAKLNREVTATLNLPDIRETLSQQGFSAEPSSTQALAAKIEADVRKWRKIAATVGIAAP